MMHLLFPRLPLRSSSCQKAVVDTTSYKVPLRVELPIYQVYRLMSVHGAPCHPFHGLEGSNKWPEQAVHLGCAFSLHMSILFCLQLLYMGAHSLSPGGWRTALGRLLCALHAWSQAGGLDSENRRNRRDVGGGS